MPKHLLVNGENFELPNDTDVDELRDQLAEITEYGLVRRVLLTASRHESLPLLLNGRRIATCITYETESEEATSPWIARRRCCRRNPEQLYSSS